MKKTIIASLVGLVFAPTSFSAENISLDEIVVTASRVAQSRENIIGDVTVIGQEEIERAGAGSLTDLLQSQPGVQIFTNGGAGKASSVLLRGTNETHVVVLVDGLRVNSATLGTTSFENIPLSQIEKIEILRGPASSLYGSDAIGGVIQIFTKKTESGKPLVHAAVGLGSYDTKTAEAGVAGAVGDSRFGVNVSSFDTDGFSARRVRSNAQPINKDDDGYRNLSVSGYLEHTIVEGHSLGLQFFQSEGNSHYDSSSNFDNYGEQTLQSYALISKNQLTDIWHSTLKLGAGLEDSDDYSSSGKSNFTTKQKQFSWQNDINLPLGVLTLLYDRLEERVDSSTDYDKTQRGNDGFTASYLLDHQNHGLQLSLREDHNTQFGSHTTGNIGYGYRVTPEWRVTASYGAAFKAPTFNQLYFPNFGNSDLRPEESENIEAGVRYETPRLRAGLTVFENKVENLIQFSGATGCSFAGFCPVNVAEAQIRGATLDARLRLTDALTLSGNLTIQSPRDEATDQLLTRRGNRYGALSLLHTWGDFQWGAEVTGASKRYNNAANTKEMEGYMLVNATVNYRMTPEWKLEARANNILDKEYILAYTGNSATSVAYNTAGSNLFVGLRYDMKP